MKLSTKARYGLRAMFDIAYHAGSYPAQVKDISRRQNISARYLDQIFQDLKQAGLLTSQRGPQGGYFLSRGKSEITVADIVMATEGGLYLVGCLSPDHGEDLCDQLDNCVTREVWGEGRERMLQYFNSVSLQTLCERAVKMGVEREMSKDLMYYI